MSTTEVETHTGEMRVMGAKGDTRVTWNARDNDEVEQARKTFDDLRAKRFLAFNATADGTKGEQITEFNAEAQKLIMVPPMAGGAGDLRRAIANLKKTERVRDRDFTDNLRESTRPDGAIDAAQFDSYRTGEVNGGIACDVTRGPCRCGAWH